MGYTAISPFMRFNYEPVNKKALPAVRKGF
jgi:hypothetical protein